MRKVLIPLLVALVAVPAVAAKPPPRPLPPDQALPLIAGPVTTGQSAATPVSKDDALAALTAAGASSTSAAAAVAAATGCASVTSWVSWGTWPYQRSLYENTYWCAVYGDHITSYSTTVTTDQTLCTRQSTDHFTYSGGVGYSWVTVQANGTWSCPIIGIVPYSVGGWLRTAYNAWGSSQIVDHS